MPVSGRTGSARLMIWSEDVVSIWNSGFGRELDETMQKKGETQFRRTDNYDDEEPQTVPGGFLHEASIPR